MTAHDPIIDILFAQDSPLEYALGSLRMLGVGEHAYVFAHPDDPHLVVRIAEGPDGWFAYADTLLVMQARDEAHRHAPRVKAIAFKDGTWIGVAERLSQIPDDHPFQDLISRSNRGTITLDNSFADLLDATSHLKMTDLRVENWMPRGDDLALNDPVCWIGFDYQDELEETHTYRFAWPVPALR